MLLSVYGVIPLVWFFLALDIFYLKGKIKLILPTNPHDLRTFLIFFLWPHVIMSLITMLDKEYLKGYKPAFKNFKIIGMVLIFSICFIDKKVFFIIYAILTLKHFTCQQIGLEKLTSSIPRKSSYLFYFFTLLVLNIWAEFPTLYPFNEIKLYIFNNNLELHLFGLVTLAYFYDSYKNSGAIAWGNFFLLMTICLSYILGYPFFSFLIPRVIHDFTAMIFYIFHDYNRNKNEKKNLLFKFIPYSKKYFFIWPILFSFLFANLLFELAIRIEIIAFFSFGIGLLHYFLEDFIWKREGLHRREIAINVDIR